MKKDLIIHIPVSAGDAEELKRKLHECPLFTVYYDGFEHTMEKPSTILSTRYYYYSVEHQDVYSMLKHLQTVGVNHAGYKIKIQPEGMGNYCWD